MDPLSGDGFGLPGAKPRVAPINAAMMDRNGVSGEALPATTFATNNIGSNFNREVLERRTMPG
jgi:hypothetical protein